MSPDSCNRVLEGATKRVRHVTHSGCPICQPLQVCRRNSGRCNNRYPSESETVEFTERLHFEIGEGFAVFLGHIRDRDCETRCDRRQQHLRWPRPGVVTTLFAGFINHQLELSDLYVTPIPTVPA